MTTDSKPTDLIGNNKPEGKITTTPDKKKDPRKVEAGKKLAAISKAAKEKKMRGKIEMEKTLMTVNTPTPFTIAAVTTITIMTIAVIYLLKKPTTPTPIDKSEPAVKKVKEEPVLENL